MKKRVVASILLVFIFAFMAWPYLVPGTAAQGFNCEETHVSTIVSTGDCGPPRHSRIGGGLKYIVSRLQSKPHDPSDGLNSIHFTGKINYQDEGYFQPYSAVKGAIITSVISAGLIMGVFLFRRHRH